jgi:hypothetical protein
MMLKNLRGKSEPGKICEPVVPPQRLAATHYSSDYALNGKLADNGAHRLVKYRGKDLLIIDSHQFSHTEAYQNCVSRRVI